MSSLHRMGIHAYAQGSCSPRSGSTTTRPTPRCVAAAARRRGARAGRRVDPAPRASRCSTAASRRARVLMRDVTDLRRRDRMLLSKDATIREIHHRVKNNLQTIASLLRLQGRRLAVAGGAGGARGVGAAHPVDRDRARDAVARRRATSCASARSCGRSCASVEETVVVARARAPLRGRRRRRRACRARSRRRSRSCSTS